MSSAHIETFLLIVGAMKSGTSSLYHYLSEHPEISSCSQKEPNFFSDDTIFKKGMNWYRNLWDFHPGIHQFAMEASTNYTKACVFPNTVDKIASVEANFKFLYILRDPIERIESHYTHAMFTGKKLKGVLNPEKIHPGVLSASMYAMQIEKYYKQFPSESILLLNFSELKENPDRLLDEVCDFLEIDRMPHSIAKESKNRSEGKIIDGALWPAMNLVAKLVPSQLTPKGTRNAVRELLGKKVTQKVKLSEAQREFVIKELKSDLTILKSEYGFDISRWGIKF